jgi:hypothetical protein
LCVGDGRAGRPCEHDLDQKAEIRPFHRPDLPEIPCKRDRDHSIADATGTPRASDAKTCGGEWEQYTRQNRCSFRGVGGWCGTARPERGPRDSTGSGAWAKLSAAPMTTLRYRLHLWVAAWLIFQVATLSALVPRDCCAAHKAQHQKPRPATAKASPVGHGSVHHGMAHHGVNKAARKTPMEQCVMRGTCKGPMSAVIALLSHHGVPPVEAFTLAPDLGSTVTAGAITERVSSRLTPPDLPPPRA